MEHCHLIDVSPNVSVHRHAGVKIITNHHDIKQDHSLDCEIYSRSNHLYFEFTPTCLWTLRLRKYTQSRKKSRNLDWLRSVSLKSSKKSKQRRHITQKTLPAEDVERLHGRTLPPSINRYTHKEQVWMKTRTLRMRMNGSIILSRIDTISSSLLT